MIEANEVVQVKKLKFKFPDSSWSFELIQSRETTQIALYWVDKGTPKSVEDLSPEDIIAFQRFFGAETNT